MNNPFRCYFGQHFHPGFFLFIAASFFTTFQSAAQCVVANTAPGTALNYRLCAQSFQAPCTNNLLSIEYTTTSSSPDKVIIIEIRAGNGVTGPVLYNALASLNSQGLVRSHTLEQPLPLTAGQTYTVIFVGNGTSWATYNSSNAIPSGKMWVNNGSYEDWAEANASWDLACKFIIGGCTAPVFTQCPTNVIVPIESAGVCSAVVPYNFTISGSPIPKVEITCTGNTPLEDVISPNPRFLLGYTSVTITAENPCGSVSCSFSVTVRDTSAPLLSCPDDQIVDATSGCQTLLDDYRLRTSPFDFCGSVQAVYQTPQPHSIITGTVPVTMIAQDGSGNQGSCTFNVTVADHTPPNMTCIYSSVNKFVNASCQYFLEDISALVSASDACGTPTISLTPAAGTPLARGTTVVTIRATDASNNSSSCLVNVNVIDVTLPTLTCPANIVKNNDPGKCGANVTFANATATDNCTASPVITQIAGPVSGSLFPGGTTVVRFRATDERNNSASCSFSVTVNDTETPVITCPPNQQIVINSGCSANVTFPAVTATDNCTASPTITQVAGPTSGSVFPVETNPLETNPGTYIRFRATDGANNVKECFFYVSVIENVAPVITCPPSIVKSNTPGQCGTIVTYAQATATDNCSLFKLEAVQSPASGSFFGIGTITIRFMATDGSGNTSTCNIPITVNDTEAPVITCPANITTSNITGQCGANVTFANATATDNCTASPTIANFGAASGSFFAVGTTSVTFRATDESHNSATCSFNVTVNDTQAPGIICPPDQYILLETACSAIVTFPNATATDNCTNSLTVTRIEGPASGSAFPIVPPVFGGDGHTVVKFRATDASGNTNDCTFYVRVAEKVKPVITCPPNIIRGNDSGHCGANVSYVVTATDNCGITSVGPVSGPPAGGFFGVGTTTLKFWAFDVSGNSSSCDLTITVNDTEVPVITCPASITTSNITGECGANVTFASVLATDNCTSVPNLTRIAGLASGSFFTVGTTTEIFRATDAAGNSATCSFNVTVNDTQQPVIICPANITANNNPAEACSAIVHYNLPNPSDNCGITSIILSGGLITGATFPVGITTNTWRATDVNGNTASCSFTVLVKDISLPAITCPANIVQSNTTGQCGANVTFNSATASDNCTASPAITNLGSASGSFFAVGTTSVTFRATDTANNSATCSFTVKVNDTQVPVISCPANITVNNNPAEACSAVVQYSAPTASDNCGVGLITLINGLSGGATFPVGITTNAWRVTDVNGNTASCSFTVLVKDVTPPAITCPANQTITAGSSCTSALGSWAPLSLTDNCNPAPSFVQSPAASTVLSGHNDSKLVSLTALDANENKAFCTFTVTLKDVTAPVARCKSATINLGANGSVTVAPSSVNNGSTDNCSFTTTLTPNTFGCAQVGNQLVTLRATDAGGNSSACTAIVTIKDLSAPTALCKNPIIYLDNTGHVTITPATVDNGSNDACGIQSMSISNNEFDCGHISGTHPVILTVRDLNNNVSTCTAMVAIRDNLPPTAVCQDVTVALNAQGRATVSGEDLASGSYDNCSVWSYTPLARVYTSANIGLNNLTITVKDWSGNPSTCISQVTVLPKGSINKSIQNNPDEATEEQEAEERAQQLPGRSLELALSPNPSTGNISLQFQLPAEQDFQLRIFDVTGRLVMEREAGGLEGDNLLPLNLTELHAGLYVVELRAGVYRAQKRLVLQRD